uniref:Uncharacterized protein n=1 Tax=Pristionchus pacificus TaxID=54126 RepID=A0A2A6CJJ4_PRIPA|eukprot:PDM78280.1 hypothetical protein PRIPAC_30859 [Pristionchus pacificus]
MEMKWWGCIMSNRSGCEGTGPILDWEIDEVSAQINFKRPRNLYARAMYPGKFDAKRSMP